MKHLLLLVCCIVVIKTHAQNDCEYHTSVPDELYRGRYKPEGHLYGNPYTMFNKRRLGWSLDGDLETIRSIIVRQVKDKEAFGYAALYKTIYENAITDRPGICGYKEGDCPYSKWVKNNAIIHLIGIQYYRIPGIKARDTFIYIPDPHDSYRHSFAERAAQGIRDVNTNIVSCWGGDDCDVLKDKAFDLIRLLQAYDLLKAAKYYPEGDGDRNNGDCTGRNNLREFSRNFYDESNRVINSNSGWKRNHGIICASALGMASIVLNDAGVETELKRAVNLKPNS